MRDPEGVEDVGRAMAVARDAVQVLSDGEVRQEVVRGSLEHVADPFAAAAAARTPSEARPTDVPATTTEPDVGRSMPAISRSNEDFPLPLGPATATSADGGNEALTPRSARTSPVAVR